MCFSTLNFRIISSSSSKTETGRMGTPCITMYIGALLASTLPGNIWLSWPLRALNWAHGHPGDFGGFRKRDRGLEWHFWIWGFKNPYKLWGQRVKAGWIYALATESRASLSPRSMTQECAPASATKVPSTEPEATLCFSYHSRLDKLQI